MSSQLVCEYLSSFECPNQWPLQIKSGQTGKNDLPL
jgi:hypothetical protein